MKKKIVCLGAYLVMVASSFKVVSASEGATTKENTTTEETASTPANNEAKVADYIQNVYRLLDFNGGNILSYEIFKKAYTGYLNLVNAGKITNDSKLTVCDFNRASTEARMWVIDLIKNKVLFNTYVAHGKGSGDTYATKFSNRMNSHQTSLGFYVTGETYRGQHGVQLRLEGMDEGFNDDALDRGVVVHGSKYVNEECAAAGRLGRSLGCPAIAASLAMPIIDNIKGGSCFFIYADNAKYATKAVWLNKKVSNIPDNIYASAMKQDIARPKQTIVEYIHNGTVDSVKTTPIVLD
jgi:hypothetical protein